MGGDSDTLTPQTSLVQFLVQVGGDLEREQFKPPVSAAELWVAASTQLWVAASSPPAAADTSVKQASLTATEI